MVRYVQVVRKRVEVVSWVVNGRENEMQSDVCKWHELMNGWALIEEGSH